MSLHYCLKQLVHLPESRMMEEAYQIFSYLPLRYKNDEEAGYVRYLWKAFGSNYENELYQFAYMSYHMLFMCFVYFTIWKILTIDL